MTSIIPNRNLIKITMINKDVFFSEKDFFVVWDILQHRQMLLLDDIQKTFKCNLVERLEVASPVEKFEYFDLKNLPLQIRNLLKDKIQQTRENGKIDTVTPETLTRWIETIREHISYYQETKRDNSPEAIERRRKQIEATKAKLAQKLWTSTPQ